MSVGDEPVKSGDGVSLDLLPPPLVAIEEEGTVVDMVVALVEGEEEEGAAKAAKPVNSDVVVLFRRDFF